MRQPFCELELGIPPSLHWGLRVTSCRHLLPPTGDRERSFADLHVSEGAQPGGLLHWASLGVSALQGAHWEASTSLEMHVDMLLQAPASA